MTITKRSPKTSVERRVAFGGYEHDGIAHDVVAARPNGGSWRLSDVTYSAETTIETFAVDEDIDAVQAVAQMYLAEMRG